MLRKLLAALALALAAGVAAPALADEGMWPFDEAPVAQVKSALGVTLDKGWLDRLRAASVRLTDGCSASIVSRSGLALTNQHCVIACAQQVSPAGHDYVVEGFIAAGAGDERACPGLEAEVLVAIEDVTGLVFGAGAGRPAAEFVQSRSHAIDMAERDACGGDPRYRCQVFSFYDGGQFKLYKYRKYTDVRLVFAPELAAAWFGGDPDNFTFPRYDLDCAFLRLYDDGRPAITPAHLAWRSTPPAAGDPVFVSGNPAATERRLTVAELESQRDVALPELVAEEDGLLARLTALRAQAPELARATESLLFETENTLKVLRGRLAVLEDPAFMAARRKEEADLEARLAADAQLAPKLGAPWADIERTQAAYAMQFPVWRQLETGAGGGAELFRYARELVRAAAERARPPGQRLPGYADSRLALIAKTLLDDRPIEPRLEAACLAAWLGRTRDLLGAQSAAVQMLLGGESPEALAQRLADGSRLGDPAVRKALWDGGMAAIEASSDPMIQFVLRTDPLSRAARGVWEQQVLGPQMNAGERIARLLFLIEGPGLYPDANFSLRLSFGRVEGQTGPGGTGSAFTTFAGLFGRATGAPPYRLPARWTSQAARLDPSTVLDFATTDDITGGNSGSPVVDARGALVGAAFDGNIQSLAGDFVYDGALNRTVVVSTAAIGEALERIYGDDALVRELAGGA